jgi:hypothetical protein
MLEIKENIWTFHKKGNWIVIPTNGAVKKNREAVMGAGLALQAKQRFPRMPSELGMSLKECGNKIVTFHIYHLLTFPVKYNWWERADLFLIEKSVKELRKILDEEDCGIITPVYLPRVGCGNGKLDWKDVKPILEKYLDKRFIICDIVE